ncbi:rRNA pseudouridine synthase [Candidatus Dependentiae bacterium]|nr:rRNA pseudouridine synthase [Candidatus Dependentiae bacterium]
MNEHKKIKYNTMSHLNKYIAHSGYCSRRKATELIKTGYVTVNGSVIKEPFYQVLSTDAIKVKNKLINSEQEKKLYFIFNKPKDVISTVSDPQNRITVMDFFKHIKQRLYPIGRLDRNTTGIILLTNDGDLTQKLSHPKFNIEKTYHVKTHKQVTDQHLQLILNGIRLEDGFLKVDKAHKIAHKKNTLAITLHSGKNHIIKRLFKHLHYYVEKLDRIKFATLSKKGLSLGSYRPLDRGEIETLKKL